MKLFISVCTVYMHIHSKSFNYTHCLMGWRVLWDLAIVLGSWNFNKKPIWAMKKGPRACLGVYRGWDTAQVYGDYIINHCKAPYSTTRIQWKARMLFRGSSRKDLWLEKWGNSSKQFLVSDSDPKSVIVAYIALLYSWYLHFLLQISKKYIQESVCCKQGGASTDQPLKYDPVELQ